MHTLSRTLLLSSIVVLSLLLPPLSFASGARDYDIETTPADTDTRYKPHALGEWKVHGKYGIGRIGGQNVTVGIMKKKYADATIAIQKYEGDNSVNTSGQYVVSRGGEVLFTTWCACKFNPSTQQWEGNDNRQLDADIISTVTTTNPKYRTQSGIGVGSTLAELRKAYNKKRYHMDVSGGGEHDKDFVACIAPKVETQASPDGVDQIVFMVGPAEGKTVPFITDNGLPYDKFNGWDTTQYDPAAKIISMDIGDFCSPD